MCLTLTIAAAAAAVVGTAVSIDSAIKTNAYTQMQLEAERDQLRQQREQARLQGMEAELARLEEFRRTRAANLAAIAGSGIGDHMSFFQGIEKAEEKALRHDLANIRIGVMGAQSRIASDIRVNRIASKVSSTNKTHAIIGAGVNFVQQGIGIADFYGRTRGPSGGGGSSGGSTGKSLQWHRNG